MTRNRMSMSCHRESSRPRCAHCFENTAFRQLNSLFPSSLRCGSRRSIVACFRSRASCTCRWTFAQRLGRQWTREQRELSKHKGSSLKSSLGPNRRPPVARFFTRQYLVLAYRAPIHHHRKQHDRSDHALGSLGQSNDCVAEAEHHISSQAAHVAEMERTGQDARRSLKILATLREAHARFQQEVEHILKEMKRNTHP